MYALNVLTALNASRAALPHLVASGAGRIVNVGAMGALQAGAGMGPYAASKAGVHRLTEALAAEWKGKVTVNAVLPSTIDTPANRASMPKADFAKWVTPQELADVILFLASDAASAVTGALLPVSGRVWVGCRPSSRTLLAASAAPSSSSGRARPARFDQICSSNSG